LSEATKFRQILKQLCRSTGLTSWRCRRDPFVWTADVRKRMSRSRVIQLCPPDALDRHFVGFEYDHPDDAYLALGGRLIARDRARSVGICARIRRSDRAVAITESLQHTVGLGRLERREMSTCREQAVIFHAVVRLDLDREGL
jgi:hypothetical protein